MWERLAAARSNVAAASLQAAPENCLSNANPDFVDIQKI
jgi:hypothetical protein